MEVRNGRNFLSFLEKRELHNKNNTINPKNPLTNSLPISPNLNNNLSKMLNDRSSIKNNYFKIFN